MTHITTQSWLLAWGFTMLLIGCGTTAEETPATQDRQLQGQGTACVQADGQMRVDFGCRGDCGELMEAACTVTRDGTALAVESTGFVRTMGMEACSNNVCIPTQVTCAIPAGDAATSIAYGEGTGDLTCTP